MKAPSKPYEDDVAPVIESLLVRVLEEEKAVREENEALERKGKEEEPDVFDSKESAEPEKVEKPKVNLDKANDEIKEAVETPEQEEVTVKDNAKIPIVAAETASNVEEEEVDVFG
ncbi:hypothetical protein AAHB94_00850 [Bacillus toyonensis]